MFKKVFKNIKKNLPDNHRSRIFYAKIKSYLAYLFNFQDLKKIQKNIKVVGITGTDGKTSTCLFTSQLLEFLGNKVGLISSQELRDGKNKQKNFTKRTTPSPFFVYKFIKKCYQNGCKIIIVEVSSHAISQGRIFGLRFDTVALTNISQEHGDYYKDLKNYGQTKLKITNFLKKNGNFIVNGNTIKQYLRVKKFLKNFKKQIDIFSVENEDITTPLSNKLFVKVQEILSDQSKFEIQYGLFKKSVDFFVAGKYNIENICISILTAKKLGFQMEKITENLDKIKPVSGRLQKISLPKNTGFDVFVDFAVTPQALQSVLEYGKNICKGKLWIVFGATGGNHDNIKRPQMGKIANDLADKVILTEDESYGESVENIRKDILSFNKKFSKNLKEKTDIIKVSEKFFCIKSRYEAIKFSVSSLEKGDVLLITGMGDLQSRNDGEKEIKWSDIDIVKEILE